jgi:hypothetical protein
MASFGFTLEHHFCDQCNENYESAWFLFPDNLNDTHDCFCSNHKHNESECNGQCEVDQSKHVEHYTAQIISVSPQDNERLIPEIISVSLPLFSSVISDIQLQDDWAQELHDIPFPPILLSLNIRHCCFLI